MWVTGCLADSLASANTGSPTPTPVMTAAWLELSRHGSCFKECGLDCEFSYQQWEWALRILNPVEQAGGYAQVWGVLRPEGVAAWSDHVHQLTPCSQCPEGCLSHRKGHSYPLASAVMSPRKGTGAQDQPSRPPGRPSGSFLAHLFSLSFNYS